MSKQKTFHEAKADGTLRYEMYALKEHHSGAFGVPIVGYTQDEFIRSLIVALEDDNTAPIAYFKENTLFKVGIYDPYKGIVAPQTTEIGTLWSLLSKDFKKLLQKRDDYIVKMMLDKKKKEKELQKESHEIRNEASN